MFPIWAVAWQNQQNNLCTQQRLRSAWASALPDQSLRWWIVGSSATHWVHCEDWSDWADAQADLSLRWVHRSFCWFCHEAAHMYIMLYFCNIFILLCCPTSRQTSFFFLFCFFFFFYCIIHKNKSHINLYFICYVSFWGHNLQQGLYMNPVIAELWKCGNHSKRKINFDCHTPTNRMRNRDFSELFSQKRICVKHKNAILLLIDCL